MCHICRTRPAVGKEHLPAKAASNRGKVNIRFIDGRIIGQGVRHQTVEALDGFWVQTLCKPCNEQRTGSRLGGAYGDFINQVNSASGIEDESGRVWVDLTGVYPLRILKQMFSMFLCAMPQQPLPTGRSLKEFVYTRDEKLPADAPELFLYKNTSRSGRIVPWCALAEVFTERQPIAFSEISWPPLGIISSETADQRFASMSNITGWGECNFKNKKNTIIQLPQLKVNTDHPLGFGSVADVEKWRTECGVIWCVAGADYSTSPNNASMVWRQASA